MQPEFWLAAGANPDKALPLARMNIEIRKTPRAYGLLARAVAALPQKYLRAQKEVANSGQYRER